MIRVLQLAHLQNSSVLSVCLKICVLKLVTSFRVFELAINFPSNAFLYEDINIMFEQMPNGWSILSSESLSIKIIWFKKFDFMGEEWNWNIGLKPWETAEVASESQVTVPGRWGLGCSCQPTAVSFVLSCGLAHLFCIFSGYSDLCPAYMVKHETPSVISRADMYWSSERKMEKKQFTRWRHTSLHLVDAQEISAKGDWHLWNDCAKLPVTLAKPGSPELQDCTSLWS